MNLYRTILAATDFSPTSDAAFEEALCLAESSGAKLIVTHVSDSPLSVSIPYGGTDLYQAAEVAARKAAEDRLERLTAKANARGVSAMWLLEEGFVSDEIVEAARRERADLVVMGTHGRRGVARVVLGSVASRVVATAPCPVLTVRSERAQLHARPKVAAQNTRLTGGAS